MAAEEASATLAKLLDEDAFCRRLGRETKQLSQWGTKESVGVPSCQHLVLNVRVLLVIGEWWIPQVDAPKPIPIDTMRKEVGPM